MAHQPPAAQQEAPLIGADGVSFVVDLLTMEHPSSAIQKIQKRASLNHPLCAPLLGLVDQLGVSRADAHRAVLGAAKQAMVSHVHMLSGNKVKLERLLNASFNYLGIQELRDVPLAVMNTLEQVPPLFLKQLAADKQIFKDLPAKVQRQVWEFDKNLLQQDALPPVGQYKYEVATVMRAMAMDEFLPALVFDRGDGTDNGQGPPQHGGGAVGPSSSSRGVGAGGRGTAGRTAGAGGAGPGPGSAALLAQQRRPLGITRKILRKGSRVLQILKSMVGSSQKIYNQIVELCVVKYRDSESLYMGAKELSYCTLRAQLLMALHDDNSAVASKDRCHDLAWTLDAGIMNGRLTDKHLAKLEKYFDEVEASERASAKAAAARGGGRKSSAVQDEAESAGNVSGPLDEPYKVLGDAAIVLRDPSATHLLLATALHQALAAAAAQPADGGPRLPRDAPQLVFVLRLLQLAVDGRTMLRDRKYRLPEPEPRALHDVLPLLCALALDTELGGGPPYAPLEALPADVQTSDFGVERAVVQRALDAIPRSEVARRLAQVFVLERLMREDYLSAVRVLLLLAQATAPKAMYEMFDFAGSLAQRLAELVKARRLQPTSVLWIYAVDNLLVKAVDSHMQVHEEVLRLLLAAAPLLSPSQLGLYLGMTLSNSKKSRKRVKKHAGDPLADFPMSIVGELSDIGSDGWPGIMALKSKSSDAVRSIYTQFKGVKGISPETAPALFEYLNEDAHGGGGGGGLGGGGGAGGTERPQLMSPQAGGGDAAAGGGADYGSPEGTPMAE